MDIIILADFCTFFANNRFLYLANMLYKKHNIEIITSDFSHGKKEHFNEEMIERIKNEYPFKITLLHEPKYKKNVCLKRFYSHYVWGKEVKEYLNNRKKPDLIYAAVPTLMAPYVASKYCEKHNIRFIVDIQDLWPEAFQMVFNVPLLSNVIFMPFKLIANGIYKRADEICAVSDTYVHRAIGVNKKCRVGHSVFLGTELSNFDTNSEKTLNDKVFLKSLPVKDNLWLAYCGTLGASYDLICVFDALKILRMRGITPPKFIVMGDGPDKSRFEKYAENSMIDVYFTGSLPYSKMCGVLSMCDITVNPIMHGAAQSIINKHADYSASGLPVINTQENEEYCNLVMTYNMGFNCSNNDANDLANKLKILMNDSNLRIKMGKNARKCAEERFDRKNTYQELAKIINDING